jgi:hypothetical protein
MVIQPTKYSCLPTCFSFLCDLNIQDFFVILGHNCSQTPPTDQSVVDWVADSGFAVTALSTETDMLSIQNHLDNLEAPAVLRVNKGTACDHAVIVYPTAVGLKVIDPSDSGVYYMHEFKFPISGLYLIDEE